jgi:predicted nucleic acid-binding Zn ribbon protein
MMAARPASDVLHKVLEQIGFERRRNEAEIRKVWNHLLDPRITAHAQPTGLRRGTLFVSVDSHVWLDEIVRYHRKEILDRLQHGFGQAMIVRISFWVG